MSSPVPQIQIVWCCAFKEVLAINLSRLICLSNDIKISVDSNHSLATYKPFSVVIHFVDAVTAGNFASYDVNSNKKAMTVVDDNRFYQPDNADAEKIIERNSSLLVMQEASDALSKLQTVTLFRPIRSLQCNW